MLNKEALSFFAYISTEVRRRALRDGLKTVLIPGVSSFECVMAELSAHYDITDIQIYNCSSVAGGTVTIDVRAPCLLFNLSAYANLLISKAKNSILREKLYDLQATLE